MLWPLMSVGLPQTADGENHLLRLVSLDTLLHLGDWYPRWMPELVGGYGSPLFNYYAPGAYYLAEAWRLLGAGYDSAISLAYAGMVAAGGLGMYFFAHDVFDNPAKPDDPRWPALVAAVAFTYAPHLAVNIYSRGALSETAAQVILPWTMWSFRRVLRSGRPERYWLLAALSLAALALAHTIALLFFPPLLLAYLVFLWVRTRAWRTAGWVTVAGLTAMGLSAFFWAPLIGERAYVNAASMATARVWLQESFWTWPDWRHGLAGAVGSWPSPLDPSFGLGYKEFSNQLRVEQVALAGVGFVLARVRRDEWWFFGALVVACGLAMSRVTEPLWLAVPSLAVIQFPWRLLTVVDLLLALFTAGALTRIRAGRWRATAGLALLLVIVVLQTPSTERLQSIDPDNATFGPAVLAQYEHQYGALGLTTTQDFILRWMALNRSPFGPVQPAANSTPTTVSLVAANAYDVDITVTSAGASQLVLATSYFPAWRATMGDGRDLPVYPSTSLGLLTVTVPDGTNRVRVYWSPTPLQWGASVASLVTLAAVGVLSWLQGRRWLALFLAIGTLGLAFSVSRRPPLAPIQAPTTAFRTAGLELLGWQQRPAPVGQALIYPYWYVRGPSPDLRFHWELLDNSNQPLATTLSRPLFQTQNTANWTAGMLVDDGYALALPPGLPKGDYRLALAVDSQGPSPAAAAQVIGVVHVDADIPGVPPLPRPLFHLGDAISLSAVGLAINRQPVPAGSGLPVAHGGDHVDYTLSWSTARQLQDNFHGFLHLLDTHHVAATKVDQTAGSVMNPSLLWDTFRLQRDVYNLVIPPDLPSGLYYPAIGLYDSRTDVLPVFSVEGQPLPLGIVLAPLKIINQPAAVPQNIVGAHFGPDIELWGYDLAIPTGGWRPGADVSLTVFWRCLRPASGDLSEYVHVYDPATRQLIAQFDSQPQGGNNPTSAWQPGEVIVDRLQMTLDEHAPVGSYDLLFGLYTSTDGQRLTVTSSQNQLLPNGEVALTKIAVGQ